MAPNSTRRLFIWGVASALAGAVVGGVFLSGPLASLSSAPAAAAPVAEFPFEAVDGGILTLGSFKGRAVLLNIWATWCPPCRAEMPSLDRLQASKGSDSFEVVALSIDRGGLAQVKPFYDEIGITRLAMYLDKPAKAMQALKIIGLPTTLLIGPDGMELARWVGPKEWDSAEVVAEIDALLTKVAKN